jgi:hypothetical protein
MRKGNSIGSISDELEEKGPVSMREYANSIVKDEWRELSKGRASGWTTRLFRELSEDISAVDPTPGRQSLIYTEMLKKVDELALARESRLVAASNIKLAPILWETIVSLLLILLVLAASSEITAFSSKTGESSTNSFGEILAIICCQRPLIDQGLGF